ncbi:hypothetical protein HFO97_07080 [Rhizobium leguminosarum]|uniref:hypothetical protein n=1 Tax=Rhizobium leguminosarum TaxID=384 RepID=UPI001C9375FB|nr:hypothetical protein [Rhizobium leguminosarum]MBY5359743.1 hypothetical protein [Rhizobium leguminosarum]
MEASATPEMDTLEARQYIVIRYKSMGESLKAKMSHKDASLDRLATAHLFDDIGMGCRFWQP